MLDDTSSVCFGRNLFQSWTVLLIGKNIVHLKSLVEIIFVSRIIYSSKSQKKKKKIRREY